MKFQRFKNIHEIDKVIVDEMLKEEQLIFKKTLKEIYIQDANLDFIVCMFNNAYSGHLVSKKLDNVTDVYILVVKAENRRKKIGSKLLSLVEDDLIIEVKEDNIQAINFYENYGFHYQTKRKNYYDDQKAAYVYILRRKMQTKGYAKINLNLKVLEKDVNDFHFVEFLMTTVDLADVITLKVDTKDRVEVKNMPELNNENNLAYRALKLMKKTFKIKTNYKIEIEKNIPIAAGMAGGSVDAAMTINLINEKENLNLTISEREKIGAELGSDVPFCITGKLAIATHYGEELEYLEQKVPASFVLIVNPGFALPTVEVYKNYQKNEKVSNLNYLLKSFGSYEKFYANLTNDLTKTAINLKPEIKTIFADLQKYKLTNNLMSGSGPTVLSFSQNEEYLAQVATELDKKYAFVKVVKVRGTNVFN